MCYSSHYLRNRVFGTSILCSDRPDSFERVNLWWRSVILKTYESYIYSYKANNEGSFLLLQPGCWNGEQKKVKKKKLHKFV